MSFIIEDLDDLFYYLENGGETSKQKVIVLDPSEYRIIEERKALPSGEEDEISPCNSME